MTNMEQNESNSEPLSEDKTAEEVMRRNFGLRPITFYGPQILKAMEEYASQFKSKVEFYRNETSKLRDYVESRKIGRPTQSIFDALYEYIAELEAKDNIPSLSEDKTAHSIALKFTEIFQDNYPKKPAWEMMDDLRKAIEVYTNETLSEYSQAYQLRQSELINELYAKITELESKDNIPEPDSQWISVKDRMPEYNTEVILIVEHWESKNRRTAICNRVNEDDCEWRTADDNSELSYSFNAIYWQPLPSPPVKPS